VELEDGGLDLGSLLDLLLILFGALVQIAFLTGEEVQIGRLMGVAIKPCNLSMVI
jgi:hypothetical protein